MAELPFFTGEEGRGRLLVLLFFVSASIITIWGTWQGELPASNEAVLAQTAHEIITTGNARTMHFDGAPVHDTPPLALWLMSFFYLLFGVNEFAARFAFVLLSVACFYIVYIAGRIASEDWDAAGGVDAGSAMGGGAAGDTGAGSATAGGTAGDAGAGGAADRKACAPTGNHAPRGIQSGSLSTAIGFLSAMILASSPLFGRFAPHITLGLPFAFFASLAFLGWLSLPCRRLGNVLWGAGIAGAVLSIGGGAFLIIVGGILASLVDKARRGLWRSPVFVLATFVGILIGGLWLFPATAASGRGFFGSRLWVPIVGIFHLPARASLRMLDSVRYAWLANLPWAVPAAFAAGRIIFSRGRRRRSAHVNGIDDALLIFAAVMFLPYSIVGAGEAGSFLPVLPFTAIFCAREVVRWLRRPGKDLATRVWTLNHVMTALFCLLMLLVAATPFSLRKTGRGDPMRDVAKMAERLTPDGARLGNFGQSYREQCARMLFYGNRSLEEQRMNPGEVAAALRNDPRMIFLSSAQDVKALRELGDFPFEIHVLFGAGDLVLFGARESSADEAP